MSDRTANLYAPSRRDLQWGDKLSFSYLDGQDAYVYGADGAGGYKIVIVQRPPTLLEKIKKWFAPRRVNPNIYGSMLYD